MSVRAETRVQPAPIPVPVIHSKLIKEQTRLAWILLARTTALGFGYLPARQADAALPPGLGWLQPVIRHGVTPAVVREGFGWFLT